MLKVEILDAASGKVLGWARSIGNDLYQIEYACGGIAGRKLFLQNVVRDYFNVHGVRVTLRVSESMDEISDAQLDEMQEWLALDLWVTEHMGEQLTHLDMGERELFVKVRKLCLCRNRAGRVGRYDD